MGSADLVGRLTMTALRTRKVAFSIRHRALHRAARRGVFATTEHVALLRLLDAATVIDVGAHRGQFALAVRVALPRARLISFEPQSTAASVYRAVVPGTIDLRECALGQSIGTAQLNISKSSDSSSLLPIGRSQVVYFPGTEKECEISVPLSTLDVQFEQVEIGPNTLLKIDVQGTELAVLKGAANVLEQIAWVYAELSFLELYLGQEPAAEIVAYLAARGFELCGVHNVQYSQEGRSLQADVLFRSVRLGAVPPVAGGVSTSTIPDGTGGEATV